MKTADYRQLEGMALTFVSGALERTEGRKQLSYTVTLRMSLDFTHFVHMANQFIPQYLNRSINAIRPELGGCAYHHSYNYFFDYAGEIDRSSKLFKVFADPRYYSEEWASAELEHRYNKPAFQIIDEQLQVTARRDFRWADGRDIEIGDLPVVLFDWVLNIMEGHTFSGWVAPATMAFLGYAGLEMVDVGGVLMRKGTRYMIGSELQIGAISEAQILTA